MRRIPNSFYQGALILAPGAICIGINLGLVASLTDNPVISIMPFNRKAMTFFFNNTDGIKGKRRLMTLDELKEQISGGDLS